MKAQERISFADAEFMCVTCNMQAERKMYQFICVYEFFAYCVLINTHTYIEKKRNGFLACAYMVLEIEYALKPRESAMESALSTEIQYAVYVRFCT